MVKGLEALKKVIENKMKHKTVSVVGLGYVGLPLAKAFSKHLKTIGFDVDNEKIRLLNNNNEANIEFTTDPSKIKHADFVIIAVYTRNEIEFNLI